jgi:hypothetical protein
MNQQALSFGIHFVLPVISGIICTLIFKNKKALLAAPIIPWLTYLVFNIYSDSYSPDKEILQGSLLFFQLAGGSFVALFAVGVSVVTQKLLRVAP